MDPTDLEQKITKHSKLIVVQHTFGTPAEMSAIRDIAKKYNLLLVEDCAHALGARYRGQKVGTLGDAAFFSFGRDKVISSVYGGALLVRDSALRARVDDEMRSCARPSLFWTFQQLIHPLVFAPITALYWRGGRYVLVALQKSRLLSKAVTEGERRGERPHTVPSLLPNALAALALHQLRKIEHLNDRRAVLAQFYIKRVGAVSSREGSIFLRYPMRSKARDYLMRDARKEGMLLGDWYDAVVAPRGTDLEAMHYRAGSCPRAERAAEEIINLPTHINITNKDAEAIVRFFAHARSGNS